MHKLSKKNRYLVKQVFYLCNITFSNLPECIRASANENLPRTRKMIIGQANVLGILSNFE